MAKALICEKWELPLGIGEGGFWAHTNTGELSRRALCFEWLIKDIPIGLSVAEYFGGIGLQSVIIRNIIRPMVHYILDLDKDCFGQLTMAFGDEPGVAVMQLDATVSMTTIRADIAILDFPSMTAKHYEDWMIPLRTLFLGRPKFVEITDVGNRYLHLHKKLYSEILDSPIDGIDSYITTLSKFFRKNFDYSVVKAAYKSGTSYMLLAQEGVSGIEFKRFGPDKSGFRYI